MPKWAIQRGRAYCSLACCPDAESKASSSSLRHKQAPRAKAGSGVWCVRCGRAFHPSCYSIYHRYAKSMDEPDVMTPASASGKKTNRCAGRSRGTKRRLIDSDSEEEEESCPDS